MAEHRYAGFRLDAGHEVFPATRHDEVDGAAEAFEHQADAVAVSAWHHLDGGGGKARCHKAPLQAGGDGGGRVKTIGAAAQDRRIAGFHAQRSGIGRHIGAAFIDDADDADGHAHPRNFHAVGTRPLRHHFAHWIRQLRNILKPLRHGLDAGGREREAVKEAGLQVLGLRRFEVSGVFINNHRGGFTDFSGHCGQRRILLFRLGQCQWLGGGARRVPQGLHRLHHVHARSPPISTMSSRWISSSRPRNPRIFSISPDFMPAMRLASAAS